MNISKKIEDTSIGDRIYEAFEFDKSLFKRYVKFYEYLESKDYTTGIKSITLDSSNVLHIEFMWVSSLLIL